MVSLEQLLKESSAMLLTDAGMVTEVNAVHL